MKKFTKKLALNKKTVADLNNSSLAGVRGGVIVKTDWTYCTRCGCFPIPTPTVAESCVGTCDQTACLGTCETCVPCGDPITITVPATNPTGSPCQKDNCYN